MIAPVIPCLSSELWSILQRQTKLSMDGYDMVTDPIFPNGTNHSLFQSKGLFQQKYPGLPDDYPAKINALVRPTYRSPHHHRSLHSFPF